MSLTKRIVTAMLLGILVGGIINFISNVSWSEVQLRY